MTQLSSFPIQWKCDGLSAGVVLISLSFPVPNLLLKPVGVQVLALTLWWMEGV